MEAFMTARAHKKKQDYLIARIMRRLDKIEKHTDYVDDDDRSVAAHDVEEVYHMEAELEKAARLPLRVDNFV